MQSYVRNELRIYLLDDHDIVRRGLRDMLFQHRDLYLVGDSGSARHAREAIPRLKPDVVVLDLQLQDGTGIDVCRAVRAADPRIRALLLTSAGDDEALRASILAGAAGYVVKLARDSNIVDAVRRVGDGKPLLDPALVSSATTRIREDLGALRPPLSRREAEMMALLLEGATNAGIAEQTGEALKTLEREVEAMINRLLGARL